MFGAFPTNNKWTPQVLLSPYSNVTTPPEFVEADPHLPIFTVDSVDEYVRVRIPAGRLVGFGSLKAVYNSNYSQDVRSTGSTKITLHDGVNTKPAGVAVNNITDRPGRFMTDPMAPPYVKHALCAVPYVVAVNEAYGVPKAGDSITGYYGATNSTSVRNAKHIGKPVKFVPKTTYFTGSATASTVFSLTAATYAGFTPRALAVFASNGSAVTAAPTMTHNGTSWVATFAVPVTALSYEYGQDADQIAGQAVRVQSLASLVSDDPFLKWVKDGGTDMDLPPAFNRSPVSQATEVTPSTVVAHTKYQLANYPLDPYSPVVIEIKGTIVDANGVAQTYTDEWYALPTSMQGQLGNFMGDYHNVNWFSGVVELASNITNVSAIRATYKYITDPNQGAIEWNNGQLGLTDGANVTPSTPYSGTTVVPSNPAGIPAELNITGAIGQLRFWVN